MQNDYVSVDDDRSLCVKLNYRHLEHFVRSITVRVSLRKDKKPLKYLSPFRVYLSLNTKYVLFSLCSAIKVTGILLCTS